MTHRIRPTLAALGMLCLTSITACSFLDVEPTSIDTSEAVFSTVSGAYNAVIGAYAPMAGDVSYGNRISGYFPYDSEDFLNSPPGDDAGEGRRGIARYNSSITNTDVRNAWNAMYRGIERANICIRYIPDMEQYKSGADMAALQRLHGEALTLRAQYFFELIRNWGDVPAPYEPTVTGQDFNIPRTDRNAILDRMLSDLDLAEKLVPWRSTVANDERITKGAVKALRARLALYRASFYFDPKTSRMERAPDYKQFYDTVRVECRELMARRGEHNLNTSFEEPFRAIAAYRPDAANEIMFQVAMGGTVNGSTTDSKLGYFNGPRVTATSSSFGTTTQGAIVVQPTYFYAFAPNDSRRDVTIAPYTIDASARRIPTTLISAYDGKFRREWSTNTSLKAGAAQSLQYNWPLIRFSDVLLMFAEAENEALGTPSSDAQAALQEVRRRAYTGTAPAAPTSTTAFREAVMDERNLEFGGEGIRKYDLIRWNMLGTKFQQIKTTLRDWTDATPNENIPQYIYYTTAGPTFPPVNSYYGPAPATAPAGTTRVSWRASIVEARIVDIASSFTEARQLLPIPAEARNTNSLLTQNPGYPQ